MRNFSLFASVLMGALLLAGTAFAQDVGAAREAICCGGECCNIGGTCRTRGQTNPDNSCQQCDPGASQTAWTDIPGCGGTDAGGGGGGGGGGCSVSPGSTGAGSALLLGLLGALGLARRRRR